MNKTKTQDSAGFHSVAQRLTDFVLQFDYETQEMWMRLFELFTKQALTEKETDEFGRLLRKLRVASAEVGIAPWPIEVIGKMRSTGLWPGKSSH